jgi:hypothetical protein
VIYAVALTFKGELNSLEESHALTIKALLFYKFVYNVKFYHKYWFIIDGHVGVGHVLNIKFTVN